MSFLSVWESPGRVEFLDDQALIRSIKAIASNERHLKADFIVYLAEVDRRHLYRKAGFPSLFEWLTAHLGFAKATAYRRVTAARLHARMPAVAAYLREGRLSLTKLCLLRDVLAPENCLTLLEQAATLSEKEVEELALILDPRRVVVPPRDSIRPIAVAQLELPTAPPLPPSAPVVPAPAPHAAVEPAPAVIKHVLKMTVGAEFMGLLEEVKAALSNAEPDASLEVLFTRCMRTALAEHARKVRAETARPRASEVEPAGGSRHIPARVRRVIWKRDGGRCTFVSADGHRCEALRLLHIHHEQPFARGGLATPENCRLVCSSHNDLFARADFGDAHMDRAKAGELRAAP